MTGSSTIEDPTTTAIPRPGDRRPPRCECEHDTLDGRSVPCGAQARFRVTVVCAAVGCGGAASVHLLCTMCLAAWRETAERNLGPGALRVRPL